MGKGIFLLWMTKYFSLDAVQEMLTWLGYKVTVCNNGNEAIEILKRDPSDIDLVILDMMMPGINVRECFRHLKEIKNVSRRLSLQATG
jgi:CheY-like chemotaxis protein